MGYYTTDLEFPKCNHTVGIDIENLGYTKGITSTGIPFEAELVDSDGELSLVVIMPAIFESSVKADESSASSDNVIGISYKVEVWDDSILDIGMVDNGVEEDKELIENYIDFLVSEEIVTFASNIINGTVMNRVDVLGNDLVKVIITLTEEDECWAYTDIDVHPFEENNNIIQFGDKKNKR